MKNNIHEILEEEGIEGGLGESEEMCNRCGEIYSIWKGHNCRIKNTVRTGVF